MNYRELYAVLFRQLEATYGPLDRETITSVVGFAAGGPVSLSKKKTENLFVTCELAAYPEQKLSSEALNYEFFSVGTFSEDWCRSVFTALGSLSMNAVLGDEHTVDISGVVGSDDAVKRVRLKLFSRSTYDGKDYGVYQITTA